MTSRPIRDVLVVAWQGLRGRPLRTALAAISLVIGVLAVMCVQAGGELAENAVVSYEQSTHGKAPTFARQIQPGPATKDAARAVVETGQRYGEPTLVTFRSRGWVPALGEREQEVYYTAYHGDFLGVRPLQIQTGSWPDSLGSPLAPRIVVNKRFSNAAQRPGDTVLVQFHKAVEPVRAVVGAVVDDGLPRPAMYVPIEGLERWAPAVTESADYLVSVHDAAGTGRGQALATSVLHAHGVNEGDFNRLDQTEYFRKSILIVSTIFTAMAAISLLVGAVGILNIGLATVGERVEELALRRAVGARTGHIRLIVLTEAMITGLFSAVVALLVAVGLLELGTALLADKVPGVAGLPFPYVAATVGIACSVGAALLGGLIPALKAAKIPIAQVMRA